MTYSFRLKLFSFLALLLCTPQSGWGQKTLNEARPEIRRLLGDLNKAGIYFLDADVDTAYQRAQVEVGLKAGILVAKIDSSIRTALNKEIYSLPADFFRMRVIIKGTGSNRTFVKIVDDPYTATRTGAELPGSLAWIHGTTLTLYLSSGGVEKVYLYYYAELTHLTSATTVSDLPVKLRMAAVYLAASILAFGQERADAAGLFSGKSDQLVAAYRGAISSVGQFPGEPTK